MGRKSKGSQQQEISKKGLTRAQRNELDKLVEELLHKCSSSPALLPAKEWEVYTEVYTFLEKIVDAEKSLSRPKGQRSAALPPFMEWLASHGAEMGPVELVEQPPFGFCVRAVADIKMGELLFSIPQKLMMSAETARSSDLGEFVKNDPILAQMPNVALAIHVLNEAYNPKSFWKPYLDALPRTYDTVMYFTPEEIGELKGSPAFEDALRMCKNIARQYAYFYSLLQKNKDPALSNLRSNFTYADYRWAVSTVMTRQNLIPASVDSASPQPPPDVQQQQQMLTVNALIPLWDFCNHQDGKFSTDFHSESRRSVCHASRDFGREEQVFIFYGTRTCAEQLIHNGFVDVNNSHDALTLRIGLSKSDSLADQRTAVMRKLGILSEERLNGPISFQLHAGPQPIDGKLLAFLRVFCMTRESLEFWLKSEHTSNLMHAECGIETDVEAKSWSFLKDRCQLLLRLYPTTREDDLKLLEEDLSLHRRMCVLLRSAEKRILLSAIDYSSHQIKK